MAVSVAMSAATVGSVAYTGYQAARGDRNAQTARAHLGVYSAAILANDGAELGAAAFSRDEPPLLPEESGLRGDAADAIVQSVQHGDVVAFRSRVKGADQGDRGSGAVPCKPAGATTLEVLKNGLRRVRTLTGEEIIVASDLDGAWAVSNGK